MSILIEMEYENHQPQSQQLIKHLITQQLNSLINHPEFNSITLANSILQNQICLTIPRGQITFLKDTKWAIHTYREHLRVTVSFIDQEGLCYLRAHSQRMKLQLMILLKTINSDLPIAQEYFVDPKTGVLYYSYNISINDYLIKLKRIDSLRKLLKYMLSQLNNYIEIILFCQPSQAKGLYQNNSHFSLDQINRYRLLLKNTRQIRQNGMIYMKKIIQIKQNMKENCMDQHLRMQLEQTRQLFHNNIREFQSLSIEVQQNEQNNSQLQNCLRHINKIAQGFQSPTKDVTQSKNKNNKIVNGLIIYKSQSISTASKQGAHSQIFKGKFMYEVVQTINMQVVKADKQKWITGKIQKTQLMLKKCNTQMISSRNSFINEICLLNHLRDSESKYIGKYYLQLKNFSQRTQNDFIYMKPYSQNLYQFIKNSHTLSMADRLTICYKISKGLCFLGSKYVLHRDFKPHNIMIDQLFNPFIIDFGSCAPIYKSQGFSVKEERLLTTKKFHISYNEIPEDYEYLHKKFTRDQYNFHPLFDVYGFGRIISYIFFNSITEPNQEEIATKPYPQLLSNILFLVKLCLEIDPDQRPAFAQITSFLGTLHVYMDSLSRQLKNRSQSVEINAQ